MRKNKLAPNLFSSTTSILKPLAVIVNRSPKHRPRDTTDEATTTPRFTLGFCIVVVGLDLFVQPADHLFAAVDPFVPVSEDHGTTFAFLFLQFDAIV